MKYTVNVTGEAALGLEEQDFDIEAASAGEAVDAARAKIEALMPAEGGALDIEVSATAPYEVVSKSPRGGEIRETVPAGVVSSFSVCFEPHESVRAEVDAKRIESEAAAAKAAERAQMRVEIEAEIAAEAVAGKVVSQ